MIHSLLYRMDIVLAQEEEVNTSLSHQKHLLIRGQSSNLNLILRHALPLLCTQRGGSRFSRNPSELIPRVSEMLQDSLVFLLLFGCLQTVGFGLDGGAVDGRWSED
jgi:hypothetical protein